MPIKYDGLFLSNPFWGFDNKSAHYMVPLLKVVKYMNPSFKTPERKIDFKKVPNHIQHWAVDENNQIQRKRFPVETVIQMSNEVSKINTFIKNSQKTVNKRSKYQKIDNDFSEMSCPIYITIGLKDKVVSNQIARKVYELLPQNELNKFVELEDVEHDTFSNNLVCFKVCQDAHEWFQSCLSQTNCINKE